MMRQIMLCVFLGCTWGQAIVPSQKHHSSMLRHGMLWMLLGCMKSQVFAHSQKPLYGPDLNASLPLKERNTTTTTLIYSYHSVGGPLPRGCLTEVQYIAKGNGQVNFIVTEQQGNQEARKVIVKSLIPTNVTGGNTIQILPTNVSITAARISRFGFVFQSPAANTLIPFAYILDGGGYNFENNTIQNVSVGSVVNFDISDILDGSYAVRVKVEEGSSCSTAAKTSTSRQTPITPTSTRTITTTRSTTSPTIATTTSGTRSTSFSPPSSTATSPSVSGMASKVDTTTGMIKEGDNSNNNKAALGYGIGGGVGSFLFLSCVAAAVLFVLYRRKNLKKRALKEDLRDIRNGSRAREVNDEASVSTGLPASTEHSEGAYEQSIHAAHVYENMDGATRANSSQPDGITHLYLNVLPEEQNSPFVSTSPQTNTPSTGQHRAEPSYEHLRTEPAADVSYTYLSRQEEHQDEAALNSHAYENY